MKQKKGIGFICLLCIVCFFSSCSLRINTIEELIAPPQVKPLNEGILAALEEQIGSVYTLKAPMTGSNRSAFILSDLDSDGKEEAIAFYQLNNALSTVHMMLFRQVEEKWVFAQDIEGLGNDVYSVEFADFDHDEKMEMVVGWQAYNNKTKRAVSVYQYRPQESSLLLPLANNLTFSAMTTVDMDEDLCDELLLFTIDSSKSPTEAYARLYGYDDGWVMLGEAMLDGNISVYTNICVQENVDGNGVAVYVDGLKGEDSMITDMVVWDQETEMLYSPFYDTSSHATIQTLKNLRVATRDINGDGIVEIAGQEAFDTDVAPEYAALIRWSQVNRTGTKTVDGLKTIGFSIINFHDGYMIALPDGLASKLVLTFDEKSRTMLIGDWSTGENGAIVQRMILSIVVVPRSDWVNAPNPEYSELMKNGDLVYAAKMMSSDADIPLTIETLREGIAVYLKEKDG